MVGVDIQDTEEDALAYVREFGLSFPNGRDVDGKITVEYGVIGLPVTFFINADGVVEGRWVGALPEDRLESLDSGAHVRLDARRGNRGRDGGRVLQDEVMYNAL